MVTKQFNNIQNIKINIWIYFSKRNFDKFSFSSFTQCTGHTTSTQTLQDSGYCAIISRSDCWTQTLQCLLVTWGVATSSLTFMFEIQLFHRVPLFNMKCESSLANVAIWVIYNKNTLNSLLTDQHENIVLSAHRTHAPPTLLFLMWMHFLHVLSPGSSHIFSPTSRHRNHKIFSLQELFSIKTAHDTRQETVWNWEPMSDGMKYFLILATDPAPWRILCLSVLQTVSVLLASLRHSSDTADPHWLQHDYCRRHCSDNDCSTCVLHDCMCQTLQLMVWQSHSLLHCSTPRHLYLLQTDVWLLQTLQHAAAQTTARLFRHSKFL